MAVSAAFTKALEKKKNGAKMLQKANKAEGNTFEVPNIPQGNYIARVKTNVGVTPKKGVPYVEFKWTIIEGEYAGKGYRETFYLENDDVEQEEKTFERLGKSVKACSSRANCEFEDVDELAEIISEINEETPTVKINVRRWSTKADKEAGEGKESGLGVYFNGRVTVTQDTPSSAPASADEAETDSISKGDKVIYEGAEYEVVTSSPRSETCTLKGVEDPNDRHRDVSWGELEVLT